MQRCKWVEGAAPLMIDYHDVEWCRPQHDDRYLFEFLVLESFQAGLSWQIVLRKRTAFQEAFDNFDVAKVSAYDEDRIELLAQNPAIIRNRQKIRAAVNNARVFRDIQEEYGSFDRYIWHFTDGQIIHNTDNEERATSPLSNTVSKDLKARGMKFVGPTIIYSFLQAAGVINDHDTTCDFYAIDEPQTQVN